MQNFPEPLTPVVGCIAGRGNKVSSGALRCMTRKLDVLGDPVQPAELRADPLPGRSRPTAPDRASRSRRVGLTALVVALAMWVAMPFLTPIAWAAVLAIAEWSMFQRLIRRYHLNIGWAAAICTIATGLLVVFPLSLVATSLITESSGAVAWIQQVQQHGLAQPSWLTSVPIVGERLALWWNAHVATPAAAGALLGSARVGALLGWARTIAGEVAKDGGLFLVTLAALASVSSMVRIFPIGCGHARRACSGRSEPISSTD